ncbi:MAG: hypothetical protein ACMVO5_10100 [Polymorphobacter sp.]|uniref:hypothetical protein n=1 Tax=Polymorphobacter sp. TaxID=1909290 RepID=UPI003A856CC4
MPESEVNRPKRSAPDGGRFDLWTAAILTTAGLLSAWASFQGGIWGGLESEHFHRANAALTQRSELSIAAGQRELEQTGLFVAWMAAVAEGQDARARFIERQFSPPFDAEFKRWRSSLPDDLSQAASSAGRPGFVGLLSGPAATAAAEAKTETEAANRSGVIADRYDRWTVALAGALFLAGMATVVKRPAGQRMMIGLAALLTLASMVALTLLPLSFGS